jgi:hypothetical protein
MLPIMKAMKVMIIRTMAGTMATYTTTATTRNTDDQSGGTSLMMTMMAMIVSMMVLRGIMVTIMMKAVLMLLLMRLLLPLLLMLPPWDPHEGPSGSRNTMLSGSPHTSGLLVDVVLNLCRTDPCKRRIVHLSGLQSFFRWAYAPCIRRAMQAYVADRAGLHRVTYWHA